MAFSWTPRPGGEPPYGKVRQGAARQGRGPVRQIRALRRRRDPRARPSRQGRVAVVVRGPARGGAHPWRVFCQVVIGQCGVSFPSEKAVGFSPVRNWPVIARVLLFHCIRA